MRKTGRSALPALTFLFALLMVWQLGAMRVDAAYILPTPIQILMRLWELREPLFTVHLPATMAVTGLGLVISVALGLGLAAAMDWSPLLQKCLYPRGGGLSNHSHDRDCPAVCAVVRLRDSGAKCWWRC